MSHSGIAMGRSDGGTEGGAEPAALSPHAWRYNLRDYGGYSTASGDRQRRGLLLRSGQLDEAFARSILQLRKPDRLASAGCRAR